jgi:plastocyanin
MMIFNAKAIEITLTDQLGNKLSNAAIWLESSASSTHLRNSDTIFNMSQRDKAFSPHILIVPQNAKVNFPNFDPILHHVYSFSTAKSFELKLYKDTPNSIVTFENLGVVELGCNIHDWMLGYILVVNSDFYSLTNSDGSANIMIKAQQLGSTKLHVWHERFENLALSEVVEIDIKDVNQKITYILKQPLVDAINFEADDTDGYE